MLQADPTGRVVLKLIVRIRDFSHLQSQEFAMILTILFGKSYSHLSEKSGS